MQRTRAIEMIDEIVDSLAPYKKSEFNNRTRYLLRHRLGVLVSVAKAEQMNQVKRDVAKAAKTLAHADARRQSKLLLKRMKSDSAQAALKFD